MSLLGHDKSADQQGRIPGPLGVEREAPKPIDLRKLKQMANIEDAMAAGEMTVLEADDEIIKEREISTQTDIQQVIAPGEKKSE